MCVCMSCPNGPSPKVSKQTAKVVGGIQGLQAGRQEWGGRWSVMGWGTGVRRQGEQGRTYRGIHNCCSKAGPGGIKGTKYKGVQQWKAEGKGEGRWAGTIRRRQG